MSARQGRLIRRRRHHWARGPLATATAEGTDLVVAQWRAPVMERFDGLRVHLGGFIKWSDGSMWSENLISDADHPLWRLACRLEPKRRRALLLFADLAVRVTP